MGLLESEAADYIRERGAANTGRGSQQTSHSSHTTVHLEARTDHNYRRPPQPTSNRLQIARPHSTRCAGPPPGTSFGRDVDVRLRHRPSLHASRLPPLDLEFKGHGTLMGANEAADFWGANPDSKDHAFGNEFDVRRIVLLSYRDNVILAHYEALKATFSRLSLDSINVGVSPVVDSFDGVVGGRPGTAASLDPGVSSFNSQGSTLLGDGGRSRATSNLSAPELPSFGSPSTRNVRPQGPPDSSQVTETVGRMLQCVSVLASVQSGDDGQGKMEDLAKALKLNWLGRGRTGRNRRGFVGGRVKIDRQRSGEEAGRHERSESRL